MQNINSFAHSFDHFCLKSQVFYLNFSLSRDTRQRVWLEAIKDNFTNVRNIMSLYIIFTATYGHNVYNYIFNYI